MIITTSSQNGPTSPKPKYVVTGYGLGTVDIRGHRIEVNMSMARGSLEEFRETVATIEKIIAVTEKALAAVDMAMDMNKGK